MKKSVLFFVAFVTSVVSMAQSYDLERLKVISEIWGETYLFHPSVVRADKNVEWEKQLVDFLPTIKDIKSDHLFFEAVNKELLSTLDDSFTLIQNKLKPQIDIQTIHSESEFDYIKISEQQLENILSMAYLDSVLQKLSTDKPLVVDLRINRALNLDRHTHTLFEYFTALLINQNIDKSTSVSREHLGWDEYNDWWFYEQRWKLAIIDKQIPNSGMLMPLKAYAQELYPYFPNGRMTLVEPINRPVYFITNNSFRSYYQSDLMALQVHRKDVYIINENSGQIFPDHIRFKTYNFGDYEFILNTSFDINQNITELEYCVNEKLINQGLIRACIKEKADKKIETKAFSFNIHIPKYQSQQEVLSQEEKILGIIKIWNVVKYFYPHQELMTGDWDDVLLEYLKRVQHTDTDKAYYTLIQEMMTFLNDSHVSTFHSSILNFSEIFVAPIKFEWIEDKLIVTAVDSLIMDELKIGDEILSIDGNTTDAILKKASEKVSASNRQGLLSAIMNPGYYTGAEKSFMNLDIRKGKEVYKMELARTEMIFRFMAFGDNRPAKHVYEDNIGYLNMALLLEANELENELMKMKDTKALILDLRSSYPTANYQNFLRMFCKEEVPVRYSSVPVISASSTELWQIETLKVKPLDSFVYQKPVAVLIDKTMISRPEDIAIALKAFPQVQFIGEQTQGTDGEMTKIALPGGGETSFTGQIVKFPDGRSFQSKGIIPDVKVERTIKGVKANKDEILDKAIEILNRTTGE